MSSAAIDLVEAAYDLKIEDSRWLPRLLEVGAPIIDQGLGAAGIRYGRPPEGGPVETLEMHMVSGAADFLERHQRAIATTPPDALREQARPHLAGTMSENTRDTPEALEHYTSHVDYCKDLLGITAVDPDGLGVAIIAPLAEVTTLSGRSKRRWQMIAAHVSAGHRLRYGLSTQRAASSTSLPHNAEAVLDPKSFELVGAEGEAKTSSGVSAVRGAAIRVDRARGRLRKGDPDKAFEIWKALVQGRWSMVDWFDTDGRRFVLAVPNPPDVLDPRGLTEREMQVVTYAMFGHSNKMIAYHLGISNPRVSFLLTSSMKKLGVRTHAQLVKKLHDLRAVAPRNGNDRS
jgi:DNA-binding CsgD family transcriptional regulator